MFVFVSTLDFEFLRNIKIANIIRIIARNMKLYQYVFDIN